MTDDARQARPRTRTLADASSGPASRARGASTRARGAPEGGATRERPHPELRRELGLPALALYGIGGMLGGGIYALVGEVAGLAGRWSWLSFLLAMLVAAPTALTYAELGARHPRSGGESWFSRVAFGGETVPFLVGWLVLFSGIVSMAALARAFAGYVQDVVPGAPSWAVLLSFLFALAGLNLRGIRLASTANVLCTFVEASGLALVVLAGASFLGSDPPAAVSEGAGERPFAWVAVLHGAALAFYAFIGFEDMVNVAEEVRRPRRAYPVAIPLALCVVGCIYAAVSLVSTAAVAPAHLAASSAPLLRVVSLGAGWVPPSAFAVVALFALANTALLNFVTTSRLAYGMAGQGLLPGALEALHRSWRTPARAILVVLVLALLLALSGTVESLAASTSFLLLAVFFTMNLALVRIRREDAGSEGPRRPGLRLVPWFGMALSVGLMFFLPAGSILVSLGVLLAGACAAGIRVALRRRG